MKLNDKADDKWLFHTSCINEAGMLAQDFDIVIRRRHRDIFYIFQAISSRSTCSEFHTIMKSKLHHDDKSILFHTSSIYYSSFMRPIFDIYYLIYNFVSYIFIIISLINLYKAIMVWY